MFTPPPIPGIAPGDDWAAVTLVEVTRESAVVGYILVRKKRLAPPRGGGPPRIRQWKNPGGRKNPGESHPLFTAHRELFEEAHLDARLEDFCHVATWQDSRSIVSKTSRPLVSPHWKSLYIVRIPHREAAWANDRHPQNGGEEPRFFSNEHFAEVFRGKLFLPTHKEALLRWKLFTPEGRRIET